MYILWHLGIPYFSTSIFYISSLHKHIFNTGNKKRSIPVHLFKIAYNPNICFPSIAITSEKLGQTR